MKVHELIAALSALPPDHHVLIVRRHDGLVYTSDIGVNPAFYIPFMGPDGNGEVADSDNESDFNAVVLRVV